MAEQNGTVREQLENINEASYNSRAGGESYTLGSRSRTRADLATLSAERNRLESQLDGGGSLLAGAYAADFGPDNRR